MELKSWGHYLIDNSFREEDERDAVTNVETISFEKDTFEHANRKKNKGEIIEFLIWEQKEEMMDCRSNIQMNDSGLTKITIRHLKIRMELQ